MPPGLLRRLERRRELVRRLCLWLEEVRSRLDSVSLALYGSYARGDFNAWSDVDVVMVWEGFRGVRFPQRLLLVREVLEKISEPLDVVPWTPEEVQAMLMKPSWRKALESCMIFIDDYGVFQGLKCKRVRCREEPAAS